MHAKSLTMTGTHHIDELAKQCCNLHAVIFPYKTGVKAHESERILRMSPRSPEFLMVGSHPLDQRHNFGFYLYNDTFS